MVDVDMAGYLSRYSGDVEMFGCGIDNDIDLEQREREQQEIINSQQQSGDEAVKYRMVLTAMMEELFQIIQEENKLLMRR